MTKITTLMGSLAASLLATLSCTALQAQQVAVPATAGMELTQVSELRDLRAATVSDLKTSNYIVTDIEGKTYDIAEILNSGKRIVIDFSAVWCGPCWMMHQSGLLERIYAQFGPEGTNEIELFWVEGEGASKASIQASNKDWSKDANGNPVPYPVVGDGRLAQTLGITYGGFPTLVVLGPGNKWATYMEGYAQGYDPDFAELKKIFSLFMTESDKPAAVHTLIPDNLYVGESLSAKIYYATAAPITAFKWEAPAGLKLSATDKEEITVTAEQAGSYEVKISVTNKNGTTTATKTIVVGNPITTFPFISHLDNMNKMDAGWRSFDFDGDGYGFDSFSGEGLLARLGLQFNPGYYAGVKNSADCLVSWGTFYPTEYDGMSGQFYGDPITPDNMLISAPITIDANASKPMLSFYIMNWFGDDLADQVKVMVGTKGELVKGTFTQEILAPVATTSSWAMHSVDLSQFKGQTIWLAFVPVVRGVSGVLLDEIFVSMDGKTASIEAPIAVAQATIYPNPADEQITVTSEAGSEVEIFALDGTPVLVAETTGEATTIEVAQIPAGRYVARITTPSGDQTTQAIVIR